jgi:hypothetical protein
MAEEQKKGQAEASDKKCGCSIVKTGLKVVLGLGLMGLGALAVVYWWQEVKDVIQGFLGLFLVLAGAITIAIAKD